MMRRNRWQRVVALSAALVTGGAWAQVKLPAVWTSHAVVQRDLPVRIWGTASPGEKITVTFRERKAGTVADEDGQWKLDLPAGPAGGPYTLTVDGTNHIELTDLLVGDVWFVSGQSNMEFRLADVIHADQELKQASDPGIRLLHVEKASADSPQPDVQAGPWTAATQASVENFSAIGFLFAKQIRAAQHVPVGVIEADWGGTPIESWVSLRGMSSDPSLLPAWQTWADFSDKEPQRLLEKRRDAKERQEAAAANKPEPPAKWFPELRSWLPAGPYNAMVSPLIPFGIRGVLWYQGESNAGIERSFYYGRMMNALIADWRSRWSEGDFPFLYVQLANFAQGPDSHWPHLREAQRRALANANTAMAVAIDVGDANNIHPKNKQEVARRLSLAARALAYGERIEYSGPNYLTHSVEGSKVRVYFSHTAAGLHASGGVVEGFEVAGSDGKFVPATARIEGNTVVVSAGNVASPAQVRYGWAGDPKCNLYNSADLPASPFTSERDFDRPSALAAK